VPGAVLAEGWRGGPQANLSRLLKDCDIGNLVRAQAWAADARAARAEHDDTVDVSVLEAAIRCLHAVVTSNSARVPKVGRTQREPAR